MDDGIVGALQGADTREGLDVAGVGEWRETDNWGSQNDGNTSAERREEEEEEEEEEGPLELAVMQQEDGSVYEG